ncbi:MAG: FdhF/YdeP family oxidoreductase [Acidobacteria bacterium]|nr:FdhF/YdeP family oxidoreductase [Acidobacteriota bacterium]MBI3422801.1 FdhF/YdeP family oxidoreductase [Acidobacteriota bacterium]
MSKPGWNPKHWAGFAPNGLGQVKPNHYLDMAKIVWRNRDQLPYAWRILSQGVCDGCALGTSGLHDYTMDGVHLCMVRLELLRLNTMPALDVRVLEDADKLSQMTAAELRELGRLPYPMLRRRGARGFTRVTWDEALQLAASKVAETDPKRLALYVTSRGLTNEAYYVAQKVARFLGTNNVDNSARICHAPSTVAMKQALGVAASTVSYKDWIGTDLLVFFGSNTPNNQPVTTKYIYYAKQQGTRVAVVNPYREPGLERYWVPSVAESALFGTKLADEFFQVHTGGDRTFIAGVLKHLIENEWTNEAFINTHTNGFAELKAKLRAYDWKLLEAAAGIARAEMLRFARLLAEAKTAIFVWSMGITQHADGVANVRAIVDLALARGFIGQPHSGLVPIRGHSGVQGGAEVGCVPNQFAMGTAADAAGAAHMRTVWGFDPPTTKGLNAVQMIEAAHAGELDWFYQSGGNFLETLPEPDFVRTALTRVPLRVHQDIVLSPQMFVEPRETVLLLPARTRYEQSGGGTETTTERRILFSPEIPGRRIGEAKNEWEIPMLIAERAHPARAHLIHFTDGQAIRNEIARAVPAYTGIETLQTTGDQVQWGGARLCESEQGQPAFATADGRAQFSVLELAAETPAGKLRLSTRRGKQFNSMVQSARDPLNGAHRNDVLMNADDARRLGLKEGDAIRLHNESGELRGRCRLAPIAPGNVQVHWPEGNVLLKRGVCDPECGIPDFNALVEVERLA